MSDNKNNFKPYIPADRVVPEFTVTSLLIGILLAIVFGAANAYLGLRVGMTISASIPAAVISMGISASSFAETPFWKTTLSRRSVLPVNPLQPEQSLRSLPCSCGQKKERSILRV